MKLPVLEHFQFAKERRADVWQQKLQWQSQQVDLFRKKVTDVSFQSALSTLQCVQSFVTPEKYAQAEWNDFEGHIGRSCLEFDKCALNDVKTAINDL